MWKNGATLMTKTMWVLPILLTGCALLEASPMVTPDLTATSSTLGPTVFPTPRSSSTPESIDTPTITPTFGAALTLDQAVEYLEDVIKTNGECELPCLWGGAITPGTTTVGQADGFFDSLGLPLVHQQGYPQLGFDVPQGGS